MWPIISHVLNEQGTGYEFLKSIELENGPGRLKEHPQITKFNRAFFNLLWPGGGVASEASPRLCNFKTVNAMVTKLTQGDVDNNCSNFRCFVGMMT